MPQPGRQAEPRTVPDLLAGPYEAMVALQRRYNEAQARIGDDGASGDAGLQARMYRPSDAEVAGLRREQAVARDNARAASRENAWMAVPALAPVGVAGALGLAARMAPAAVEAAPLVLTKRDPYLRVGDNWATRAGRRAHAQFKAKVEAKGGGWHADRNVALEGQPQRRPDALTPARNPIHPKKRHYLELKPDTPTGRAAGRRAIEKYQTPDGNKTRVIYYKPKDFI